MPAPHFHFRVLLAEKLAAGAAPAAAERRDVRIAVGDVPRDPRTRVLRGAAPSVRLRMEGCVRETRDLRCDDAVHEGLHDGLGGGGARGHARVRAPGRTVATEPAIIITNKNWVIDIDFE